MIRIRDPHASHILPVTTSSHSQQTTLAHLVRVSSSILTAQEEPALLPVGLGDILRSSDCCSGVCFGWGCPWCPPLLLERVFVAYSCYSGDAGRACTNPETGFCGSRFNSPLPTQQMCRCTKMPMRRVTPQRAAPRRQHCWRTSLIVSPWSKHPH